MAVHCVGCSTTAGVAGCPEHGSNTYPRSVGQVGVNDFITNCRHGVDLRFVPRCYLCRPAESDEAIWQVTPSGHVHKGEWCEMCVQHGVDIEHEATRD